MVTQILIVILAALYTQAISCATSPLVPCTYCVQPMTAVVWRAPSCATQLTILRIRLETMRATRRMWAKRTCGVSKLTCPAQPMAGCAGGLV